MLAVTEVASCLGDALLPHLDVGGFSSCATSLLCSLLQQASLKDKAFIAKSARAALTAICQSVSLACLRSPGLSCVSCAAMLISM